jgi:ATP-dependent DNA helicase RecQ
VGRTRAVEILRGGRSKVIEQYAYDSLGAYGSFAHLRGPDVLQRVDALLAAGTLRSTGGRFPKLRAA